MSPYLHFSTIPLALFAIVLICTPVFSQIARRVGLLDKPDERKQHEGAIPLVGGLAIFIPYIVYLLWVASELAYLWPSLLGLFLLLGIGLADDCYHVRPIFKFAVQVLAATFVVLVQGMQITSLGNLFSMGDFDLGFMSIPFSLACIMLLINAINLMDGLDGLAGGVSFIILGWFGLATIDVPTMLFFIAPLMAAIAGFLIYNLRAPWRKKASVFLGDAGALALGFAIAWFALLMRDENARMIEPIAVAWILAVPIWDECAQFYRRVREGHHPFSPDRGHFHHHFVDAGFSVQSATACVLMITFITGAVGYLGIWIGVPEIVLTLGWIFILLLHMVLTDKSGFYVAMLRRLKGQTWFVT